MVDLTTTYVGLPLRTPIVASAAPLNRDADVARRLADAGAAAIVLPSLFEEEIVAEELALDHALDAGAHQFAEAASLFPALSAGADVGARYLADLERVKAAVSVPIIASLNATTTGAWCHYARHLEDAGADAIELNLYHLAADPATSARDIERRDLDVVAAVRAKITVPLAVKLSPYYSALAHFGAEIHAAGADGLVLFNRFYQPDIDLDTLDVVPRVSLSEPSELRLPLRWIAILRPLLPRLSLAASSGIGSGTDVVKALLVGADVAMVTSAVLRNGPVHLAWIEDELTAWLAEREYDSVDQLRGSMSHATTDDPSAFERANYISTLHSWRATAEAGTPRT